VAVSSDRVGQAQPTPPPRRSSSRRPAWSSPTAAVTIIDGRYDRVVSLATAEFLDERLPSSRLAIVDGGHFIWEEAPVEYAAIVIEAIHAAK
jgi:pimeloyl-ACP methyl ester carboxylesterase